MSRYTTEIRYICEMKSGIDDLSGKTPDEIIAAAIPNVFDFGFPIYKEEHREELCHKILRHYYTREIGAETYELWKLWLNARMNEIMPKYNQLYMLEEEYYDKLFHNIDVHYDGTRTDDLLHSSDYTRTDDLQDRTDMTRTDNLRADHDDTRTDNLSESNNGTKNSNTSDERTTGRTKETKFSDTPQGGITYTGGETPSSGSVGSGSSSSYQADVWLTNYTKEDEDVADSGSSEYHEGTSNTRRNSGTQRNAGTQTNTGTVRNAGTVDHDGTVRNAGTDANTGTVDNVWHEYGYRGSKTYAELLAEYADKVVNIDLMIINELSDLFMLIW